MTTDQIWILVAFVLYFAVVLGIGYYFYHRSKNLSDYVLGGRTLNPYVTALSAQASDMSGWLLLGLPGSIYLCGMGEVWIGIGLAIGSYLAWLFIAKRLRKYSEKAGNAITVSEFFANRFRDEKGYLRTISAVVILVFFTIYVASGFVAGGNVFQSIFPEMDYTWAMLIGVVIVISYTFLGGFKAICWTDFLQGMLMLVALIIVPLSALGMIGGWGGMENLFTQIGDLPDHFTDLFYSGGVPLTALAIISSLSWGFGYFGMPHIIVRYMGIKNPNDIKIARRVGTIWVVLALILACLVGLVGRAFLFDQGIAVTNPETTFILMTGAIFPAFIAGILYSALMAAVMSTADSQLLVASSAVTNDLYFLATKKDEKDRTPEEENKLIWISRIVVAAIAIIAALFALDKNGAIMDLVSYAWAGFGAAFGPIMILSLFWKRMNAPGALAGMIVGFMTIILWNTFFVAGGIIGDGSFLIYNTGIYELLPGFIFAFIAAVVVALLTKEPDTEIQEEFSYVQEHLNDE